MPEPRAFTVHVDLEDGLVIGPEVFDAMNAEELLRGAGTFLDELKRRLLAYRASGGHHHLHQRVRLTGYLQVMTDSLIEATDDP